MAVHEVFYEWNRLRLSHFTSGNTGWKGTCLHGISYFDQVEFFRRSWLWPDLSDVNWEELFRFFKPHRCSFLVDVIGDTIRSPRIHWKENTFSLEHLYSSTVLSWQPSETSIKDLLSTSLVRVLLVETTPQMKKFVDIYLECFEANSTSVKLARQNMMGLKSISGWFPYLLYVEDVLVGGAAFYFCRSIAFLSSVSILPQHRNKGFHRLLIHHRIRKAQELGASQILTYAYTSGQSHHNLQECGFRSLFEISTYRHNGE